MRASSLLSRLLCASSAPWRAAIPPQCAVRGVSSLNLFFERPVRSLLNADGPRRKELLELPESEPPLQAVRAALRRRMPDEALDIVTIRHGKRPVETDDDLRAVLDRARQAGHDGTIELSVVPADGTELEEQPPAPDGRRGPISAADASAVAAAALGEATAKALAAEPHQMLSFYRFCSLEAGRLPLLELSLTRMLAEVGARGTVYLAEEGVNSQLAVPLSKLEVLRTSLARVPELAEVALNVGKVVEPEAGGLAFKKLLVKRRAKILSDGFDTPLDWERAGRELSPKEWHAALLRREKLQRGSDAPAKAADAAAGSAMGGGEGSAEGGAAAAPLLIDCRNDYESSVGSFSGATRP